MNPLLAGLLGGLVTFIVIGFGVLGGYAIGTQRWTGISPYEHRKHGRKLLKGAPWIPPQ